MAAIRLATGDSLKDYGRPYIVAEVNSSHNGNKETAKEMVRRAKEIGCNCVKFQSWSAESLYSNEYYKENPISKRIVTKFALNEESLFDIAQYCKEQGIAFSSTPYSEAEVDFLADQCNVPFLKIASMDINNYPFVEYIASKGLPVVMATGMADMEEIRKAVNTVERVGNPNLCILHCISIYPAEASMIRLNNILGLRKEFPDYPIGFSDHSLGTEMAIAATALGAALIEKHFTLDKKKMGMDNNMATEPEEFETMISHCCHVYEAMGEMERIVSNEELEQRKRMRRSIVAARDLEKGHVLKMSDMTVKRPGTGLPPEKMEELVGKKLSCAVKEGGNL